MSKVDIFSGFLGAGKTTLMKKLIEEAYVDENIVIIENEFGEIGIDGGFLKETGIQVNEMNSGCICCTLVGDFSKALDKVIIKYKPDRILIEPSGVGKLSDVISAVQNLNNANIDLESFMTVVDARKYKVYMKNFGEFYENQIKYAGGIILSHTKGMSDEALNPVISGIREINDSAVLITSDWDSISGKQILDAFVGGNSIADELKSLREELHHQGHHHHHHEDGCHCHDEHHHNHENCCQHDEDHHHEHESCCHHDERHHHDHEEHCHHHDGEEHKHENHGHKSCCHSENEDGNHKHSHEHHHHHEEGHCHHHGDSHDGHHHADEVFDEIGVETANEYSKADIENILKALGNESEYGYVLRAKGIVEGEDGFIHFDYIPEEPEVRDGTPEVIGKICVIGVGLKVDKIKELMRLN